MERADVAIDVVSKGKTGILGIGGEPARVRVTLLETRTDLIKVTSEILEELVKKMGVDAVVNLKKTYQEDLDGPIYDIEGEDSGLLIGRRGETLRSFQVIVGLLASRKLGERVHVSVDVSGYQERRNQSLVNLAQRVANRVKSSGRPVTLEPMPPNERRVVHMSLANVDGISTFSTGEGDGRQIVIEPDTE